MKWLREEELLPSDIVVGMLRYSKTFVAKGVVDDKIYEFFKDPKNVAPVRAPSEHEIEGAITSASVWGVVGTPMEPKAKLRFEIGEKTMKSLDGMYKERYSDENARRLKELGERFDRYLEMSNPE
jgi:hypothetical protein